MHGAGKRRPTERSSFVFSGPHPGPLAAPGAGVARLCALPTYQRRQPEGSVLYRTLQAHLETFLARTAGDEGGGLPPFVTRELRAYLLDRLDVLLGGRVAEELIFGDVSTGAQDDLQRATDMARHMVTRYGMSEALGLATFELPRQALFLNVPSMASASTARRRPGASTARSRRCSRQPTAGSARP